MTRLRTCNNRAKRPSYAVFVARRRRLRHLRKKYEYSRMYGMGTSKLSDYLRGMGDVVIDHTDGAIRVNGEIRTTTVDGVTNTITGRVVHHGPFTEYQFPKTRRFVMDSFNYAKQEEMAHIRHRVSLAIARAKGDVVIEHTATDATVVVKEG